MKKHLITLIILLSAFLPMQNASAFDGNRKGFVLSGGVGWTEFQIQGNKALTIGSIIGYGINNKNLIVFDRSIFFEKHGGSQYVMDQTLWLGVYHYYSTKKKSFYSQFGYRAYLNTIILGGGYMFSNNIQLGITYSHITKFSDRNNMRFLISYVAF